MLTVVACREVTSRLDKLKFRQFLELESDVRSKFDGLKKTLTQEIVQKMQAQKQRLDLIREEIEELWTRKRSVFVYLGSADS